MARFGALLVTILMPLISFAQSATAPAVAASNTNAPTISAEERTRAKKRLYPGGRDEEPLQIQSQLVTPSRAAINPDELPEDETD